MSDTSGVDNRVKILESGMVTKHSDGWKLLNGQSVALEIE